MKRILGGVVVILGCSAFAWAASDGAGHTPTHPPAAEAPQTVVADASLMNGLRDRRTALDERERQLNEREAQLNTYERELNAKTAKLESEIRSLEDRVGIGEQAGAAQKKRTEDLVGALSRLSPRKAAPIIARADIDLAVQVLARIPPDTAMAVLSQIDPATAAILLGRLTQLGMHRPARGDK